MAEETTINYYTHRNPVGHGAAARTRHSTPEFAYNYDECLHESRPQSILSNYEFGTNALRMKNYITSMHEHITSESSTRARLRVFLKPREKRQGEKAPELHAIIKISKKIDVYDWENIVRGRLVPALLTRGHEEDLLSHVVTGLTLDVPIVSDVSTNTKPIETSTPQITDFFKKTGK